MFQPQRAAELDSFGTMALALESRIEGVTGTVDAGAKKFSVLFSVKFSILLRIEHHH